MVVVNVRLPVAQAQAQAQAQADEEEEALQMVRMMIQVFKLGPWSPAPRRQTSSAASCFVQCTTSLLQG